MWYRVVRQCRHLHRVPCRPHTSRGLHQGRMPISRAELKGKRPEVPSSCTSSGIAFSLGICEEFGWGLVTVSRVSYFDRPANECLLAPKFRDGCLREEREGDGLAAF